MDLDVVTGDQVKKFFYGGFSFLEERQQEIDRLNVFPVPDGDTGRNMYLTMAAAVKEMDRVSAPGVGQVSEALAKGSLMGARGNSGVILSQLIRGLAEAVKGKETISVQEFARAWQAATTTAYRAVIKPVEGTMLTVARGFSRGIMEASATGKPLVQVLAEALEKGYETLQMTPELLPVLKKAGVVDAGGKGLMVLLEGGLQALRNGAGATVMVTAQEQKKSRTAGQEADFTYLYCVSLLLETDLNWLEEVRKGLHPLGGSMVIGGAGNLIKLHIHTNNPGQVLSYCLQFGVLHNIEIANMRDQYEESHGSAVDESQLQDAAQDTAGELPIGLVAVGAGEGITSILKNLGVNWVIEGGQTMNPPVEEFVKAIKSVPSSRLLVLPNNKNLILAAEQAKKLVEKSVLVVPSKSIPGGIAALLAFNPDLSLEENCRLMTAQLDQVKVGEVTYAVRDAVLDGTEVKQGDYIGISKGEVKAAGASLNRVVTGLIGSMVEPGDGLVTLYAGAGVSAEEAGQVASEIREEHPDLEVEVQHGGQPVYYYLISVE